MVRQLNELVNIACTYSITNYCIGRQQNLYANVTENCSCNFTNKLMKEINFFGLLAIVSHGHGKSLFCVTAANSCSCMCVCMCVQGSNNFELSVTVCTTCKQVLD